MPGFAPRLGSAVLGFLMFAAGVAGTWLTWRYFVGTHTGQRIDNVAFEGAEIGQSTLWRGAEPVLDVVSIPFIVVVLGAAALIAVLRQRWLLALQVTVLVGGANLTTQVLKHLLLDRPDLADTSGPAHNSLPSGHTTVAASVAAALVLVVPRRIRPAVAVLAGGYAAVTGVATMIVTAISSSERVPAADDATVPTAVVSGLMIVVAAIATILAASGLMSTADALADGGSLSRGELIRAYTGGAFGVAATTAALFAAILLAHQFATRPGPDRAADKRPAQEHTYS